MKQQLLCSLKLQTIVDENLVDELEPELEQDNDKKAIESNNSAQPNKREHSWLIPFLINICLAHASYSIVQPSPAPYLIQKGIPESGILLTMDNLYV